MPRTAPADLASTLAALTAEGATIADVAAATGLSESGARVALARYQLEPAPAPRGRPRIHPPADRTIRIVVTAAQYQALEDYADRHGFEIDDAIRDNLLGQCWDCSEPAILDARKRPLCERCCERTGRTEAPADDGEGGGR